MMIDDIQLSLLQNTYTQPKHANPYFLISNENDMNDSNGIQIHFQQQQTINGTEKSE